MPTVPTAVAQRWGRSNWASFSGRNILDLEGRKEGLSDGQKAAGQKAARWSRRMSGSRSLRRALRPDVMIELPGGLLLGELSE